MNTDSNSFIASIISLLGAVITLITALISKEFHYSIILFISFSFILALLLYLRSANKKVGYKTVYNFEDLRNSAWTRRLIYFLLGLMLTSVLLGVSEFAFHTDTIGSDDARFKAEKKNQLVHSPCQNRDMTNVSSVIGIARFAEGEEDFSDFVKYEIESKSNLPDLQLVGLDEHISPGVDGNDMVNEMRDENCIDTGMIVHGSRNANEEVFFCKINFFNYHRTDTLIRNPGEVEFSYSGHSRYLADFILAHEYYRRGLYDHAVRLLLDAKEGNVDTSFVSLANYYLGNVYLELGKPIKAEEYFSKALGNVSVEKDVLWQLNNLAESIQDDESYSNHTIINEPVDFFAVFQRQMLKIYKDKPKIEFVRIDADHWDESKSNKYTTMWLLTTGDSLYCYQLVGEEIAPNKYSFMFNKDWSAPAQKGFQCELKVLSKELQDPNNKHGAKIRVSLGWAVHFYNNPRARYEPTRFIRYTWYYRLCKAGKQAYQKDGNEMTHKEARRWRFVRDRIIGFSKSTGIKIHFLNGGVDLMEKKRLSS